MRPLLIIRTGRTFPEIARLHGDFDDWIRAGLALDGVPVRVVDVAAGETIPGRGEISGAVVTGSPAMVTDRLAWSERTAAWLPGAIHDGVPLLGICYGHQLLAHALGGDVGPNPLGPEAGTIEVRLEPGAALDALLCRTPDPFTAQTSHFQAVLTLPPGARRLAHSTRDPNHVLAFGDRAWGVQFHPEFGAEIARSYVAGYADVLRAAGEDPDRLREGVRETREASALLRRFGEIVAAGP